MGPQCVSLSFFLLFPTLPPMLGIISSALQESHTVYVQLFPNQNSEYFPQIFPDIDTQLCLALTQY